MSDDERTHEGSPADRQTVPPEYVIIGLLVLCLTLVSVAVGVGALLLKNVSDAVDKVEATMAKVERIEERNRQTNNATAFRLCSRNSIDRAFAQSFADRQERKRLQGPHGIPILDCDPNLHGQGAKVLPPGAQDAFVERWQRRRLSPIERGICPESRIGGRGEATNC